MTLRHLLPGDEAEVRTAQHELARDHFRFVFWDEEMTWPRLLEKVASDDAGVDVAPGWVRATFLVAVHDGRLVGRTSIRHELNDHLLHEGGHIGYGVRPAWRRRGFATSILRQSLQITDALGLDRVLVTCDDDNEVSAHIIESAGGVLEDVRVGSDGAGKRRYWIDRSAQVAACVVFRTTEFHTTGPEGGR